jgi:alkaline phosphatase D
MKLTRRDFLKLAAQAGLAAPFILGPTGCALLAQDRFDAETGLSFNCVIGDVTADGAIVWLRSEPGSFVTVEYAKDPALTAAAVATPAIKVADEADFTAHIALGRLDPGTVYHYRAVVAGKKPGPVSQFKTAPGPDDMALVKFSFSGDTRENYKPFAIMDAIRATAPDFFIHLGDTIYADRGGTASKLEEFWAKYRGNRDDAPSRRLFAQTSFYVIWDDHEVRDNYDPGHPLAPIGQKAFLDYWPIRVDSAEPKRIYRSFRWGRGLELFLLDDRQYRDRANGSMLGAKQKEWLLQKLAGSTATFKVIASSVPLHGGGADRWDGFPDERREIFHWIRDHQIHGVVFISADLHFASMARIWEHPNVKEVVIGPMAAPLNSLGVGYSRNMEFFTNKTFNYGTITIDPKAPAPRLLVEIRDEVNGLLYKTEIAPS